MKDRILAELNRRLVVDEDGGAARFSPVEAPQQTPEPDARHAAVEAAMYSASHDERATMGCFCDCKLLELGRDKTARLWYSSIVHVSRHVRIAEALELEIVAVLGVDESIMQRARDVA
jgi:hypothetical protein